MTENCLDTLIICNFKRVQESFGTEQLTSFVLPYLLYELNPEDRDSHVKININLYVQDISTLPMFTVS